MRLLLLLLLSLQASADYSGSVFAVIVTDVLGGNRLLLGTHQTISVGTCFKKVC